MKILSLGKYADEQRLLQALRQKDLQAEAYLYKQNKAMVIKMVLENNGTRAEAEDLYQETMLIAHDKITRPDFELTSKLSTFIYKIAQNQWKKQLRHKHYQTHVSIDSPVEEEDMPKKVPEALQYQPEEEEILEEQFELLQSGLAQLSEPCKEMLMAWYEHKHGQVDELIKRFNKKDSNALKKAVHRCREKLRQIINLKTQQ